MIPGLAEFVVLTSQQAPVKTQLPDRFEFATPLVGLPPVVIDKLNSGYGIAHQTARSKNLQGRMLWVDATANLDRINTADKVIALVERAKRIGFNTIVLDVKPIVGYTLYPSTLTGKLTKWKEQTLPHDFDPVPIAIAACRANGISIFVSLNAFSEGHRMAHEQKDNPNSPFGLPGPGYDRPDEQTVQYVAVPFAKLGQERAELEPTLNPTEIGEDKVGIYTGLPTVQGTSVFLDANGKVLLKGGTGVPPGGRVLVGKGKGAEFLNLWALPGRKLEIVTVAKFLRAQDVANQIPLMMNPTHPKVRERAILVAREFVSRYAVDGLLYDDRLRFGGVDADFSPQTRAKFEQHVGAKLNWPDDVFKFTYTWNLERGSKPGKYWDRWWTWRAQQLQTWVVAVRKAIKTTRPSTQFGIYAGSWYGEYSKWGANYARPGTRSPFNSVTNSYSQTGFGDQLDVFVAGCYYPIPTIADALAQSRPEGRTVESGAALANRVIHDQAWTYAGIMLSDFYNNPEALEGALQSACAASQGVMVFDLSHRFDLFEPTLTKAFKYKKTAPHQVPGLLGTVREIQAKREKLGLKEPPIFAQPGAPGVGH